MEIYAEFETLASNEVKWDEYVKYVEVNKKGYEIYVLNYREDMMTNVDFYVDLINSITITTPSP
jgi:hypothetical protein